MGQSREARKSSGELGESSVGLQEPIRESRSNSLRSTLSAIQSRSLSISSVEGIRGFY